MVTKILRSVRAKIACGVLACAGLIGFAEWASADPGLVTQSGLPVQVQPTAPEPGLPQFSYPAGNPDTSGGGGVGSSSVNYNACPGCDPTTTMMAQSWGQGAVDAATAAGVTGDSLAATCVVESNCQNIGGAGTVSGPFQMTNATYLQAIQEFAAANPDLSVDTSLAGKSDPANEAYAAAQYEADAAQYLQNNDIPNPTNLDIRGYYQFGQGPSAELAAASDSANLESIVQLSPAVMAANGITSTTTVGQWRQSYINKVGSLADQPVLL
jgi:hypothetical protein